MSTCRRLPQLASSQSRFIRSAAPSIQSFSALRTHTLRPSAVLQPCSPAATRTIRYKAGATEQLSSVRRWKGTFGARTGKAVEPNPDWEQEAVDAEEEEEADAAAREEGRVGDGKVFDTTAVEAAEAKQQQEGVMVGDSIPLEQEVRTASMASGGKTANTQSSEQAAERVEDKTPSDPADAVEARSAAAATGNQQQQQQQQGQAEEREAPGPLEAVLHMPSPEIVARQHPHMSPPPYVHHFDTYSLVKQLGEGGYTQDQAILVMKGVRQILATNLDVAQASLVSKSDVENESYLFRAACSELSTEIKNNRRLQDEQMRQQRTHLQHEVDILTQSLNQELLTMSDNVRGNFNDRKMAVREEQKGVESAVQQISYKISIMLSSDAKSEIESVRWILIRRSVLGILFMAVLTLGTLRYATYVTRERAREAERVKKEQDELRRDGGRKDQAADADAAVILAAN